MKYTITLLYFLLSSLFYQRLSSQCLQSMPGNSANLDKIYTSGDLNMDQQISAIVNNVNSVFGTKARFYFYNDDGAPNAQANSQDMNIYIGINFLNKLQSSNGITGVAFILAHELSHIYQYSTQSINEFMNNPLSKNCELQADYLAAFALGKIGFVSSNNYMQMLEQSIAIGDVAFDDEDHHGTNNERMAASIWGYTVKYKSLDDAYAESYSHINAKKNKGERLVYVLKFNNGNELYVLYGGKICSKERNGNYEQLGQFSSSGNTTYPFSLEFSTKPEENFLVDLNNNIYDITGKRIGKAILQNTTTTNPLPRTSRVENIFKPNLGSNPLKANLLISSRYISGGKYDGGERYIYSVTIINNNDASVKVTFGGVRHGYYRDCVTENYKFVELGRSEEATVVLRSKETYRGDYEIFIEKDSEHTCTGVRPTDKVRIINVENTEK